MWSEILKSELIVIHPQVKDKNDLFTRMVNHVYNNDYLQNRDKFLKGLIAREQSANTSIAPGIALPHFRNSTVEGVFASIIILKEPLDWGNPQMGKVRLVFFLGADEANNRRYLQLVAGAARLLQNQEFCNGLLNATTPQQVLQLVKQYDVTEDQNGDTQPKLVLFYLHQPDSINTVLQLMMEAGLEGGTVFDGGSAARRIAYGMPMFAGFNLLKQDKNDACQIICSEAYGSAPVHTFIDLLKQNRLDIDKKGVGYIQVINLAATYGNKEEDIDF